ncbi:MAG: cytochrome c1 [Proteobacteria bacterium]|nr:cytochrome c1 [Pseudomonadota bacterium]MDE3208877.1 cytochrome c1 [Pseudomonadota bacterium]
MKKLIILFLLAPLAVFAAQNGPHLDKAPINFHDEASLQRGARDFTNYCLSCHSAQNVRYELLNHIGLSNQQIEKNLMAAGGKVGDKMKVAMRPQDAKKWFGIAPPDLGLMARVKGPDWLYAYLRDFYRDDSTQTGWNNTVYPKVAMPDVLWALQGTQVLQSGTKIIDGRTVTIHKLVLAKPGKMTPAQYNAFVGDLVNFMTYMGQPYHNKQIDVGIVVLLFLGVLFVLVYMLKKEYWKDIH